MLDTNTFLTTLYVMCDDFCKTRPAPPPAPGAKPSLCCSEVITLSIFAQWRHFASERDFYRYALRHLRPEFPHLPHRAQFNRLQRQCYPELVAFWQHLTRLLRPTTHNFPVCSLRWLLRGTRCHGGGHPSCDAAGPGMAVRTGG